MSSLQAAVEAVAECVEDRYVQAAEGVRAAAALREHLANGRYRAVPYDARLAEALTADLQEVLPDLHLQVRWSGAERTPSAVSDWDDPELRAAYWAREDLANQGFDKAERLPGNVGFLAVRNVEEPEGTAQVIDAAFAFLARCNALVLDLRRTTGGAPSGVSHLLGHLLPPGTPLLQVVNRSGVVVENTATPLGREPTLGPDVPVFVLVGRRTVSGCEELAYDLRAAGRATLVGRTTLGAANPVDVFAVDRHLVVRMPTAYVRNVVTGGNWEGVGITPDIDCAVDDAPAVAHRLAAQSVRARVEAGRLPHAEALVEELADVLAELDEELGDTGRGCPRVAWE